MFPVYFGVVPKAVTERTTLLADLIFTVQRYFNKFEKTTITLSGLTNNVDDLNVS